jgi:peptidyl-prolyl cis-trans isomerase A (cyclophilin A)
MSKRGLFAGMVAVGLGLAVASLGAQASLKNPASLTEKAPENFKVSFDTSAGSFIVDVHRAWAPLGADRFYNLVKNGFFDNVRFFRVIPNFMVQFGINGDPAISKVWQGARIGVDPVKESNLRGYITFAMAGTPDSRTTQVFINFKDNAFLDKSGFAPFGQVSKGMDVVDKIYAVGEGAPSGPGPSQGRVQGEGNAYLMKEFPKLDYIKKASILP